MNESRRTLLKTVVSGGGIVTATNAIPEAWSKPIIESVILPAHATTTSVSMPCGVPLVVQQTYGDNRDVDTSGKTPETGASITTKKSVRNDLGVCVADKKPIRQVVEVTYTITDGTPRSIHIETYVELYCGGILSRIISQNYNGTEANGVAGQPPQNPNFWIGSYSLVVTSCPEKIIGS